MISPGKNAIRLNHVCSLQDNLKLKFVYLKGIVQPFELGGVNRLIRSAVKFCMAGNLKKFFNGTMSREELKTDLCGLMISEMTLSNHSHFPRFFSPQKMTYRNLADSGL
jgi:hypothetical protein